VYVAEMAFEFPLANAALLTWPRERERERERE